MGARYQVRWAGVRPAHRGAVKWTLVHWVQPSGGPETRTACYRTVPDDAYLVEADAEIPATLPRCAICRGYRK